MAVLTEFQAPILNTLPSTSDTDIGEDEIERRRLALQYALSYCLTAEDMAQTVRLCEQEFARKSSFSVSEFCQRLFETNPQIQLDKESRLRLLRAMRQPTTALNAEVKAPEPAAPEIQMPELVPEQEPAIQMPSPEDSTSPELAVVPESIPEMPSPEDSASPELFVLRYANLGKEIIG